MSRKPRERKGPTRRQAPKPSLVQPHPVLPDCQAVVRRVCDLRGVQVARVISRHNEHQFYGLRKMIIYACRYLLGASYPSIGRVLHRDSPTVMRRLKEMEWEMRDDRRYAWQVGVVMNKIQQPHGAVRRRTAGVLTRAPAASFI